MMEARRGLQLQHSRQGTDHWRGSREAGRSQPRSRPEPGEAGGETGRGHAAVRRRCLPGLPGLPGMDNVFPNTWLLIYLDQ